MKLASLGKRIALMTAALLMVGAQADLPPKFKALIGKDLPRIPTQGWVRGQSGRASVGNGPEFQTWTAKDRTALFFIRFEYGPGDQVKSRVLDVAEFSVVDSEYILSDCLTDPNQKKEDAEVVGLVRVPVPKKLADLKPYYGPARLAWRLSRRTGRVESISPGAVMCTTPFVDSIDGLKLE